MWGTDATMADGPTEREQAALEILFHEPDRERIQLSLGRLGDSDVVFVVHATEAGSLPLAVLLGEEHLQYVDVSRSQLPASVMSAALEAARASARAQAEAMEAQAARVEELIRSLEANRRAEDDR